MQPPCPLVVIYSEPASSSGIQLANPGNPNQDLNIPGDISQDKMGKPMQPRLRFPQRSFSFCIRTCQASWDSQMDRVLGKKRIMLHFASVSVFF